MSIALQVCIMAGCDYVKSLSGIGLKMAPKHIKQPQDFIRSWCY